MGGPLFDTIKENINTVVQDHLGIDSAQSLRQSTQIVKAIQSNALNDLAELKVQILVDFEDQPIKKPKF